MTLRPTDAELAACEDAARRADAARSDAEYQAWLVQQPGWNEPCWRCDRPRRGMWPYWLCERCLDDVTWEEIAEQMQTGAPGEPPPDEPVPHRSRGRPVAPAEEPRDG